MRCTGGSLAGLQDAFVACVRASEAPCRDAPNLAAGRRFPGVPTGTHGRHRRCNARWRPARAGPEVNVLDIAFVAATAAFFLLGLAYVRGCDRL